ncbi:TlpA family protein disulfide reductase [Methylomarinum vadi]|uniref:TlpA family protein disulfide reductase n=1 Tax=Methylomarinum vadi TaxID=438855 RepID=UPI0004DF8A77|nr:TlpA disulfide reductase family protein [Methylomarinum vadi]
MKQNLMILLAALLALTGGIMLQKFTASPAQLQAKPRLDIKLPDVKGKMRDINEWRGKILIINFWATWCPPCLKEIPEFVKLQTELTSKNVQFIGIAIEEQEPVAEFLASHSVNYPMLIGGDAGIALSQQLGNIVGAVPFTVIVNPTGQIVHRHPGELSKNRLLELLSPLIDQAQTH